MNGSQAAQDTAPATQHTQRARRKAEARKPCTQHRTQGVRGAEQEPGGPGHRTSNTTHRACTPAAQNTAQGEQGLDNGENTHPKWKIQDASMRQERQEKVWSLRSSVKGRRRRRQEKKANAGDGKGLRQGEWKEGGGEGEGQHTGAPRHRGGDQGNSKEGGRKEGRRSSRERIQPGSASG